MQTRLQYMELSYVKIQYSRAPLQEIAHIVVTFRNKVKSFPNNLLLNVFSLQHAMQQDQPETTTLMMLHYLLTSRILTSNYVCHDDPHRSTHTHTHDCKLQKTAIFNIPYCTRMLANISCFMGSTEHWNKV